MSDIVKIANEAEWDITIPTFTKPIRMKQSHITELARALILSGALPSEVVHGAFSELHNMRDQRNAAAQYGGSSR